MLDRAPAGAPGRVARVGIQDLYLWVLVMGGRDARLRAAGLKLLS